jgi:hypothetical protein
MTFYDIKNGNRFPETLKAGEREECFKAGVNFIFIL